ncbi:hypothetical protein TEA_012234 [Camellia sinensis var. sinensis]|uniref:Gnk2-homologous domain-containing protein n=1 Tax=Camellia sinensis var. sinensis TaxID=542762 RepID=A0A4S4DD83_CAMSN|nr:hypothetical protein TEA_012234 [Camellia sinensis var. sinensis]
MGSQFESNLKCLIIRSLYNNRGDSIFFNDTQGDYPDKVYGLFLCSGDVPASVCQNCINVASNEIVKDCPFKKVAIIWYDECLIRYSYRFSNLSIVATSNPSNCMYATSKANVTKEKENSQEVQLLDLGGQFGDEYNSKKLLRDKHTKSQDFPSIQLDLIHAATKHFSEENKLGEGGFGPVYKKLWSEGQGLELMDPLLVQSSVVDEVLKCIHIGLLCVQEDPADRPTVSSVVVMLASDTMTLPQSTKPAFSVDRLVFKSTQSSPNVNELSVNECNPRVTKLS